MPGFLYYLPNCDKPSRKALDASGVGYAFPSDKWSHSGCLRGPDGGRGLVLAAPDAVPTERVRYTEADQTWRQIPGSSAWLGWFTDEPPGPIDLRREKLLEGYPCPMADGREWIVPLAREAAESDGRVDRRQALPRRLELNADGEFSAGDVLPDYCELNEIAARFLDASERSEAGAFSFEAVAAAVRVLAHNYRIDRAEAVALGLFTFGGDEAARVLLFCTDFPGWWKLQKKTAAAITDSSAGPADSTDTTGPPGPI
jgi:hypothetical protein